jgi:hypothetical protein
MITEKAIKKEEVQKGGRKGFGKVSRYGCGRRKGKNEDMYAQEQIRSESGRGSG